MTRLYASRSLGIALATAVLVVAPLAVFADTSVSIQSLSPSSTISVGTPVTFTVTPSGFSGPSYSVTDSFSGSTVSSNNINSSGQFSWTPTGADVGTHTLTLNVTDGSGNTNSTTEQIVVSPQAALTITALTPGTTVTTGTQVSFGIQVSGFTNPVYTLQDTFSGSSLGNGNINSSGAVVWTPQINDVGTHTINLYASDSYGHSANGSVMITVSQNTGTTPVTTTGTASTNLNSAQVQAILSLLQSFGADQSVINNVAATLGGQAPVAIGGSESTSATLGDGYVFTTFMEQGDSGDQITELQERLAVLGYFSVDPTGYFGPVTEQAVEDFQGAKGIDQVGYVGPATRAALNGQ